MGLTKLSKLFSRDGREETQGVTSKEIYDSVVQTIDDIGWNYVDYANETLGLELHFAGDEFNWITYVEVYEAFPFVTMLSVYDWAVPLEQHPFAAWMLNDLNCDLWFGNWEMNPRNGNVRFRMCLDFDGANAVGRAIGNALTTNLDTVHKHGRILRFSLAGDEDEASTDNGRAMPLLLN